MQVIVDAAPPLRPCWTVVSAGKTFRVKTCSARLALAHAEGRTKAPAVLSDLTYVADAPPAPRPIGTRLGRRRAALMPEVLRRRAAGDSVTGIARAVRLPRETVRDWLSAVGA